MALLRPLLDKYLTVVVKVMFAGLTGVLDPNAAAAAANKLAQEAKDRMQLALGIKPACANPEIIDPQTEEGNPVTEDATRVYQPINTSQGSFGYVFVDRTSPAKYQIDSKNTLWKMILAASLLVVGTGTLYGTYSI